MGKIFYWTRLQSRFFARAKALTQNDKEKADLPRLKIKNEGIKPGVKAPRGSITKADNPRLEQKVVVTPNAVWSMLEKATEAELRKQCLSQLKVGREKVKSQQKSCHHKRSGGTTEL